MAFLLGRLKRTFCFKTRFDLFYFRKFLTKSLFKTTRTLKQNNAKLVKTIVLAYPAYLKPMAATTTTTKRHADKGLRRRLRVSKVCENRLQPLDTFPYGASVQ